MINSIHCDEKCHEISCVTLEEEGISVEFGEDLTLNGDLDFNHVAILKPDLFYNTRRFATPPRSVDGIIIVEGDIGITLYIAELKSSRSPNINKTEIQAKFDTIFKQFLTDDYSHIFEDLSYNLNDIKLWLVCDPFQLRKKCHSDADYISRVKKITARLTGMMADMRASYKPYKYKGHSVNIQPMLSPPTIYKNGFVDLLNP